MPSRPVSGSAGGPKTRASPTFLPSHHWVTAGWTKRDVVRPRGGAGGGEVVGGGRLEVVDGATPGGGRKRGLVFPASLRIGRYQIAARFSVSMQRPGVLIGTRTMGSRFTVDP